MDSVTAYNLIVLGVDDRASPPNMSQLHSVPIFRPEPLQLPIKINVGGPAHGSYLEDQEWSASAEYGYLDGMTLSYPSSTPIGGTSEPEIYRTERFGLVFYNVRFRTVSIG